MLAAGAGPRQTAAGWDRSRGCRGAVFRPPVVGGALGAGSRRLAATCGAHTPSSPPPRRRTGERTPRLTATRVHRGENRTVHGHTRADRGNNHTVRTPTRGCGETMWRIATKGSPLRRWARQIEPEFPHSAWTTAATAPGPNPHRHTPPADSRRAATKRCRAATLREPSPGGKHTGGGPTTRSAACYVRKLYASSLIRPRVLVASSGMPGPIVVDIVALVMYRPLEVAGFRRRISSSAAA